MMSSPELNAALQKYGISRQDILQALERFGTKKVLVVGDLIIDVYTQCTAIGKTAKTPTLSAKRGATQRYWGGASLIANNILSMGGRVTLVAVTGDDWGHEFFAQKKHDRLQGKFFKDMTRPTTVKERFWVDGYKLLQVDTIENHDIPQALEDEIFGLLESTLRNHDLLMVADNRHGIMTKGMIERVKKISREKDIPLVVDTQVSSRWGNLEAYADVDLICVNEYESRYFLRDENLPLDEVRRRLIAMLHPKRLLIKLQDKGMMGWDAKLGDFQLPAFSVPVVDPIGSGDSFLSAAALSFDPQIKLLASIFLASCAGAIAVTKMGTDPITDDEIRSFALDQLKALAL